MRTLFDCSKFEFISVLNSVRGKHREYYLVQQEVLRRRYRALAVDSSQVISSADGLGIGWSFEVVLHIDCCFLLEKADTRSPLHSNPPLAVADYQVMVQLQLEQRTT